MINFNFQIFLKCCIAKIDAKAVIKNKKKVKTSWNVKFGLKIVIVSSVIKLFKLIKIYKRKCVRIIK